MPASDSGCICFRDLTLTLTYRCNYRCASCMLGEKLGSKEALTYEDAVSIVESAAELRTIERIALVGGEPFLVYPLMLRIADYMWRHYRICLTVSTNGYWARSREAATDRLRPLARRGLTTMLLSWDGFHARFGQIEQIANAITACRELDILPTVQSIVVRGSDGIAATREQLSSICDVSHVRWVENPCIPVGRGSEIRDADRVMTRIDELPYGRCTAGMVLNVQASGEVKPCCGAGLMADALTMGNIHQEALSDIVQRSSVDPLINSLVGFRGPKQLVEVLRAERQDHLIPRLVTDTCDACYRMLTDSQALQVLRSSLGSRVRKQLLCRVASEEFGQYGRVIRRNSATADKPELH